MGYKTNSRVNEHAIYHLNKNIFDKKFDYLIYFLL